MRVEILACNNYMQLRLGLGHLFFAPDNSLGGVPDETNNQTITDPNGNVEAQHVSLHLQYKNYCLQQNASYTTMPVLRGAPTCRGVSDVLRFKAEFDMVGHTSQPLSTSVRFRGVSLKATVRLEPAKPQTLPPKPVNPCKP